MKAMKRLLSIFLSLCLLLCACAKPDMDYIQQNSFLLDLQDEQYKDLKALAQREGWDAYQIFFTGETHATQKNFESQLYFLKFFHQNYGIRYILCEDGFCSAQLLNQYINSGNEKILQLVMKELEGTAAYSMEAAQYYQSLYEYQKNLPEEEKIVFLGIDLQHQFATGWQYVFSLLPSTSQPSPKVLQNLIDSFERAATNEEIFTLLSLLQDDIKQNPDEYRAYLNDEYFNFSFSLNGMLQSANYYALDDAKKYDEAHTLREQAIIDNFNTLYELHEKPRLFGQFGSFHSNRRPLEFSIASFLDTQYSPTIDKVLSIAYLYSDSQYADSSKDYRTQSIKNYPLAKSLAKTYSGQGVLIRLDPNNGDILKQSGFVGHQYGFLIQDSAAVKKFAD